MITNYKITSVLFILVLFADRAKLNLSFYNTIFHIDVRDRETQTLLVCICKQFFRQRQRREQQHPLEIADPLDVLRNNACIGEPKYNWHIKNVYNPDKMRLQVPHFCIPYMMNSYYCSVKRYRLIGSIKNALFEVHKIVPTKLKKSRL